MTTLGALVLVVAAGGFYAVRSTMVSLTTNIEQKSLLDEGSKKVDEPSGRSLDGPIDLLFLGVDARLRTDVDDVRSDSIIILHIPASHDQAYLISIPRDSKVEIPAWPKSKYRGGTDKINAAFQFGVRNGGGWEGGAQLMSKTITKLTGIQFDGMAIIDFNGFKGIVDALGTVNYCIDQGTTSTHMVYVDGKPRWKIEAREMDGKKTPIIYKEGCQQMPGWAALDYSRERYGFDNGDYDRQLHQRQLLKAMAQKATSAGVITNPAKIRDVVAAAGKSFILDTGNASIEDFLFTLKELAAADLLSLKVNKGTFTGGGSGGTAYEVLLPSTMQMFAAVKNDTVGTYLLENPEVLDASR
ncbi:LCP family protein required for cell wall assembly [Allocatelliglobosispora scoriae]|uniref:LCP family protein required for cell wall assembly n=1 Tax=Allocatelliglobosispora scoriae TaxID=643052 RepID=A0A841BUM5_9ACTN|nr:LCP family protein [Allocatelliglobosispora scoriae]MBB5870859.1 LCP family protein required for cell wall assembly [Allocatelliglobosispora scoriae]